MRGSTTTTKITSPYKQQKPLSKPKVLEDFNIVEPPKETINEQPSSRLLDAYGVPRTHSQQKKTADVPGSLEAFISRSKTSNISTTTIGNLSTTIQNDLQQRIRVCVRKRPLNKKEQDMHELDIVPVVGPRTIQLNVPKTKIDLSRYTETHAFTFDDVFDGTSSNEHIYARTAQPLVDYIFTGGKATCFAHGQTGSGKTYTMLDTHHGLYVLAAQDIFRMLSKPAYAHLSASVGFYEIYQGQLYDLLNEKQKLTARDDGNGNIVIANLREYSINDVNGLMTAFEHGNKGRTTGKTGANNTSSRSHAVLQVFLKTDSSEKVYGKLSFIDLAGSERGADRGDANTKTRMEGAEINKSLLALKECIRALDQDKKHTPFRGSKLTQVLRDSFIGNSRTCMIATISPNNSNSEHTLNTLRYADR
ncbi:P-loop containing nucleoside triphosphate hydrolase protein, partial [Pilaira anomala]